MGFMICDSLLLLLYYTCFDLYFQKLMCGQHIHIVLGVEKHICSTINQSPQFLLRIISDISTAKAATI
jgi:hypothetical protein